MPKSISTPPPDGKIAHRRVTPKQYVAGTQLYTYDGWRETKWRKVSCLREQRDGRSLNPPDPVFEVLTARLARLHYVVIFALFDKLWIIPRSLPVVWGHLFLVSVMPSLLTLPDISQTHLAKLSILALSSRRLPRTSFAKTFRQVCRDNKNNLNKFISHFKCHEMSNTKMPPRYYAN